MLIHSNRTHARIISYVDLSSLVVCKAIKTRETEFKWKRTEHLERAKQYDPVYSYGSTNILISLSLSVYLSAPASLFEIRISVPMNFKKSHFWFLKPIIDSTMHSKLFLLTRQRFYSKFPIPSPSILLICKSEWKNSDVSCYEYQMDSSL